MSVPRIHGTSGQREGLLRDDAKQTPCETRHPPRTCLLPAIQKIVPTNRDSSGQDQDFPEPTKIATLAPPSRREESRHTLMLASVSGDVGLAGQHRKVVDGHGQEALS